MLQWRRGTSCSFAFASPTRVPEGENRDGVMRLASEIVVQKLRHHACLLFGEGCEGARRKLCGTFVVSVGVADKTTLIRRACDARSTRVLSVVLSTSNPCFPSWAVGAAFNSYKTPKTHSSSPHYQPNPHVQCNGRYSFDIRSATQHSTRRT